MLFYFYNDLPQCMLNIETVEKLLLERFQIYCSCSTLQDDTEEFNYSDRVAHLFMCIITIDFPFFKDTFINGEIKIFREKLLKQSSVTKKKELNAALQYLISLSQNEDFRQLKLKKFANLKLVIAVLQTILSRSSHVFKKSHSDNCRKLKMTLPFTFPLKLISNREIEFLLEIELALLKNCKEFKKVIYEVEDDRIRLVIKRFVNFYNGSFNNEKKEINAEELDEDSRHFPPCMANLHQILRHTHRLSYESRYQYTLFLKDIGMSVDENISLWEEEYSKPHVGSTCTHEWEEKQKRYIYQIQHMYGLVGSHGLKSSHSCDKFIGVLQSKMDGGCPFQHMTSENLAEAIPRTIMELPDVEDIFKHKNSGLPQKACAAYLNCQRKISSKRDFNFPDWSSSKVTNVTSPLHYYNIAKRS